MVKTLRHYTLFPMILALSILVTWHGYAAAAEIVYVDSVPLTQTDWKDTLQIPQFDPALGELNGIELALSAQVDGKGQFESLDAQSATITVKLIAKVDLMRPDGAWIVDANPQASEQVNVTAYDGTLDFDGTSGKTFSQMIGYDKSDTITFQSASDFSLFIGTSMLDLPVQAFGESRGEGAGNLALSFTTAATARVSVKYIYEEQTVNTCPVVAIQYLGEGPGTYTLPDGYETFVVKKFQPFRFDTLPGTVDDSGQHTYTSTRNAVHKERVWACSGACDFITAFHQSVELGRISPGVTIHLLVIDDDVDDRLNGWVANGDIDNPYQVIANQAPVQTLSLAVPFEADWSYHAVDSIGVVSVCLLPEPTAHNWTVAEETNVWSADQRAAAATIADFEMGEAARRLVQVFLPAVIR